MLLLFFHNTVAASCPTLTVANGDVSQTYPEGGTATYTCHSGYTLVDGGPTRTCQAGGNWDGAEPRCIRRSKEHINICLLCIFSPTNKVGKVSDYHLWYMSLMMF